MGGYKCCRVRRGMSSLILWFTDFFSKIWVGRSKKNSRGHSRKKIKNKISDLMGSEGQKKKRRKKGLDVCGLVT